MAWRTPSTESIKREDRAAASTRSSGVDWNRGITC
jgi:hypothetical protein